jgi:hypothetical protein
MTNHFRNGNKLVGVNYINRVLSEIEDEKEIFFFLIKINCRMVGKKI